MREKRASRGEAEVAALAERQHGVVSLAQLAAAGIGTDGVSRRTQAGRLHRIHRGVYAVGHRGLSSEGRWLAAVMSYGGDAALSHHSAAGLWRLLPPDQRGAVHVVVSGYSGRRRRDGIVVHRSATLARADLTRRYGIPVTTPARTIADLRRVAPRDQVEAALDRARVLGLPIGDLGAVDDPTRSQLERRFLRLCRRHRLPPPEVNVPVGPFVVDFLWREQRLVVETDGFDHHRDRATFEADRARDARLKVLGYDVLRFTYRQVVAEPDRVARTVSTLLWRLSRGIREEGAR